ncbi:MAG: alpha-galactosidase [Quadrisphaera sp.]
MASTVTGSSSERVAQSSASAVLRASTDSSPAPLTWAAGDLTLTVGTDADGEARIARLDLGGTAVAHPVAPLPPAEVGLVGLGRSWSARRYADSATTPELLLAGSQTLDGASALALDSVHRPTGLAVRTVFEALPGARAVRSRTTLTNTGEDAVEVAWVTSLVLAGLLPGAPLERLRLHWADNDWLAENRWTSAEVREVLPDLHRAVHQHDPRGAFERSSHGNWSTDGSLPVGVLHDPATDLALAWQVESSGGWHWQVGERTDGVYLSALGPTDAQHQWSTELAPGESFTTVPVTLAASAGGVTGAFAELTAARRATRRPHPDTAGLPVIFNDYMNTLMGDPTTAKLLPLVAAAAEAGAEVFCIDAGWYGGVGEDWWDGVGAWEPAADRFPGGIDEVLDAIRAAGMVPGLWLEPEVIGVRSPLADQLPEAAFFSRRGRRLVEHGRYQLDLRHPAARAHLDAVVDRLVLEHGVGYFKLDHNIDIGSGTDREATSPGEGLLGHQRAHLAWLDGVLDRHPSLVLESCASGGMRVDHAVMSRAQVQSTSDQQDLRRYPPIAAAAATAVLPEQAASWAYPQPDHTDDEIAFTLVAPLLGRVHLSGHLDHMDAPQKALVAEAVTAYKAHRASIPASTAFWPLGLPGWEDGWVAHGLQDAARGSALLAVWRRDDDDATAELALPCGLDPASASVVFPRSSDASTAQAPGGALAVTLPTRWTAVLLHVQARPR